MAEVITYEVKQTVRVRKYPINTQELACFLKSKKKEKKISNDEIAEKLNVPKTMVEHWFRTDNFSSIPEPYIWESLKKLLSVKTDKYDAAITTFIEKDNVFDKGNRIYDADGISPTILCSDSITIITKEGD